MSKLRKLAIAGFVMALVLIVGGFTNLIEFHYLVRPENDPLLHPVAVRAIEERKIVLVDGRVIETWPDPEHLREFFDESGLKIDVDVEDSSRPNRVTRFVKRRAFVCGLSPAIIRIPIFAREIPANQRWPIGEGTTLATHASP